jgi:hypothetical protein
MSGWVLLQWRGSAADLGPCSVLAASAAAIQSDGSGRDDREALKGPDRASFLICTLLPGGSWRVIMLVQPCPRRLLAAAPLGRSS